MRPAKRQRTPRLAWHALQARRALAFVRPPTCRPPTPNPHHLVVHLRARGRQLPLPHRSRALPAAATGPAAAHRDRHAQRLPSALRVLQARSSAATHRSALCSSWLAKCSRQTLLWEPVIVVFDPGRISRPGGGCPALPPRACKPFHRAELTGRAFYLPPLVAGRTLACRRCRHRQP